MLREINVHLEVATSSGSKLVEISLNDCGVAAAGNACFET